MSSTDAQRLAQAEATARRWLRKLEVMAGTDESDEMFCIVHGNWLAAERMVVLIREGAPAHPTARRS